MNKSVADLVDDPMSAHHTFKVPDAVRDVLARSTITATSVKLPEGQLERKLYTDTNKVLEAAGGKWNKKSQTHEFAKDPREALGIAVTEGKATNTKTLLQAFYTPKPLAERVARAADLKHGHHVLEPSMGGGALVLAAASIAAVRIVAFDINPDVMDKVADMRVAVGASGARLTVVIGDFLTIKQDPVFDAVLMNPPFQNAQDMAHVTHAWGFVKPGGVLVAIMWPAWQAAKTKTAEAFRELVASAAASDVEDIEAGTFEDTAVRTIMLTMHKAGL